MCCFFLLEEEEGGVGREIGGECGRIKKDFLCVSFKAVQDQYWRVWLWARKVLGEYFAWRLLAAHAILVAFACLLAHDSLAMLVDLVVEDCKGKKKLQKLTKIHVKFDKNSRFRLNISQPLTLERIIGRDSLLGI